MIDIGWLVENGPCLKFTAGNAIPCPGGPEPSKRAMYILLIGKVDVHKKNAAGGTHIVSSIRPGDVFGGREYFTDADDCSYITGVDSVVYVLSEESFNDLSWSRPEIVFEILRTAYTPPRKKAAVSRSAQQEKAQTVAKAPSAAPTKAVPAAASPTEAKTDKIKTAAQTAAPAAQTAAPPAAPKVAPTAAAKVAPTAALQAAPAAAPTAAKPTQPASPPEEKRGFFPQGHKSYPDITRPEYLKLVFPKEYTCPFCKATFKDFRVFRSKLYENSPMRYDLRKFFTGFQTEWYDVLTCRSCFFSTFHNYFTEPKPMQKGKVDKGLVAARGYVQMDFSIDRDIDFVFTSHYLAILCSACYPSVGKQIRAKLWGNISWLYEDVGDKEMEKFAAEKAAEAYEQVYTESRLTPVQEQITCLSIAGMQHRAGMDNNLKKFIFTAKTLIAGDKTYAKIAEDFMYELKMDDNKE